ncbi:D-sedoheptulose-7-phosphate isomerase [Aminipila terrae]|uniref:SIS domain-containing protein n=1 Tax=Aminipila terrae TaxID=2697030 RepID=A0A6P1MBI9_9FIRM|nr:SIS domain-containing protein [Aminipila terrae]QHI72069.1 SIS domain-containing protein [Aminipila terrae]
MKNKKRTQLDIFNELLNRYSSLECCKQEIWSAYELITYTYKTGGKVLVAGNGGSAADSEHIVGEMMKSFLFNRKIANDHASKLENCYGEKGKNIASKLEGCLPTISLVSMNAISTAYCNDVDPLMSFAQLTYGLGEQKDLLWGISTSGNSENILNAIMVANAKGMKTLGLSGKSGGEMKDLCSKIILVPEEETFKIQELHLPIYHALCAMTEAYFFEEK